MTHLRHPRTFTFFTVLLASNIQACSSSTSSTDDDDTTAQAITADEVDDGTSELARAGDEGIEETADAEPDAAPPRADDEDEPDDFAGDDPNAPPDPTDGAALLVPVPAPPTVDTVFDALTPLSAPAKPKHPRIGISNSRPEALTRSPAAWKGIHVSRLRVFVPWDVALRGDGDARRDELEGALSAAGPAKVELLVMFSPCSPHDADSAAAHFDAQRNPKKIFCKVAPAAAGHGEIHWAPKAGEYDAAFKAFRAQYILGDARARQNHWPHVRFIGAWNEPNFGSADKNDIRTPSNTPLWAKSCGGRRGDACGATLAAHYYKIAEGRCLSGSGKNLRRQCRIVAGEFTSDPGGGAYWTTYQAGLHGVRSQPLQWSIHPTHDVEREEFDGVACAQPGCTTKTFASWVDAHAKNAQIWLTETAADYRDPRNPTQTNDDRDAMADQNGVRENREKRQVRGMLFALHALPSISPRITRIYLYDFQQDCTVENGKGTRVDDSGLLAPECQGTPGHDRVRPAYTVLANRYR